MQIWEELLEPRPIGIRDNFFHLGGHSLLAAQLIDRIEQASAARRLALSTLFAKPTVEQLAEALHEGERAGTKARPLPVQARREQAAVLLPARGLDRRRVLLLRPGPGLRAGAALLRAGAVHVQRAGRRRRRWRP